MSMTYWLQLKNSSELKSIENDLSILYQETQTLDELCQTLNVPLLSSFIDTTDAAYNAGVFDDQLDPDSDEPAYTPEQMQWFSSEIGLPTFQALRIALLEDKTVLQHLSHDHRIALLEELDLCISTLEQPSEFHLELLI